MSKLHTLGAFMEQVLAADPEVETRCCRSCSCDFVCILMFCVAFLLRLRSCLWGDISFRR